MSQDLTSDFPQEEPVNASVPEPEPEPEMPEFLTPDQLGGSNEQVVTILTPNGAPVYQPTTEALPLFEILRNAGLQIHGSYNAYMDGAEIGMNTTIPVGATVSIVGNVKGA